MLTVGLVAFPILQEGTYGPLYAASGRQSAEQSLPNYVKWPDEPAACTNATGNSADVRGVAFAVAVGPEEVVALSTYGKSFREDCDPDSESCRESRRLTPGLPVKVMFKRGRWTCAVIEDQYGRGSTWLPSKRLEMVPENPARPIRDWVGTWEPILGGEKAGRLAIRLAHKDGTLTVDGEAIGWRFHGPDDTNPTKEVARIVADGVPLGEMLTILNLPCEVTLRLVQDVLAIVDNSRCDGMNARFWSLWKRKATK